MPPSIKRMRVICQREKLRKSNDLTRKHRALSIYATWLLVQTPVTADQVTIGSILSGLVAAALLASPGLAPGLAGCIFLYTSFLMDQVDGEVARYRRRSSLRGVYLDEIRHLVVYAVPVFALGFDAMRRDGSSRPVVVSFAGGFALALARIEERLPALIFGERAGRWATESTESTGGANVSSPVPPVSTVASILKTSLRAVHATYEVLAHQVLILLWFLAAVVLDRGFDLAYAQATFLVALTLATYGALLSSIRTRLVPGALEADAKARACACVEAGEGFR